MSEERVVYSIQKTYILKFVSKSKMPILTCDERIDIPTIEPLTGMKSLVYPDEFAKIIPCIELAGIFSIEPEYDFEFETNEGVTVLPKMIKGAIHNAIENPYLNPRFVLVLPRGTTGIKSCKIVYRYSGEVVQHNLTFGIMPPPYNYDNALFGYLSYRTASAIEALMYLDPEVTNLEARVTALENKAGG